MITRKRTRSAEDAAELAKLTEALGSTEAISFRGKTYTVDEILDAGLKVKLKDDASPGLSQRVKALVVARFRAGFTDRIKASETARAEAQAQVRELNAKVTRLQGELSLAQRAGALKPEEISYIRTLVDYGMKPAEVARTLGIDVQTVLDLTAKKQKPFSWGKWAGRRDAKKGRALDL